MKVLCSVPYPVLNACTVYVPAIIEVLDLLYVPVLVVSLNKVKKNNWTGWVNKFPVSLS